MMGKPIEESGGHLGVAEDRGPLAEAQVGRNDDTGAFVEFALRWPGLSEQRFASDRWMFCRLLV